MKKIAIVDYGMGNLRSVAKAFESFGAKAQVTSSISEIKNSDKVVLPGVGAFTSAVVELQKRKLVKPIVEGIRAGKPYLGLCLGLQLLFESSEENEGRQKAEGFGVIPGKVKKFTGKLKVPHMGWNQVKLTQKNCPLFKGIPGQPNFYFVHSYFGAPKDKSWTLGLTDYGGAFCSAVWKDNVYALQFHPEKSQETGLRVLKNYAEI